MIDPGLSYLLYWDDDAIPITGNMTFGNHLDNDIIVGGEDVNDFHARVDLTERGPVVIPLGNSTLSVNGQERSKPLQLIIGDVIGIGQATMQIGVEVESRSVSEAAHWTLHSDDGASDYPIQGELIVGRAEAADINIPKEHISRNHARIVEHDHYVWIQDLNSANGTRINNTLLHGGARLFHGDYVSFDKDRYQLIGKGGDLTPVQTFVDPMRGTTNRPPPKQLDTTEFTAVEGPATLTPELDLPDTGAFLIGSSESVDGKVFRVGLGESIIGRGEHCNIIIPDTTVSHEHAQITVRPEGVTVINLMTTNGTKVNGVDVTSAKLEDGDVLRLGRVSLVFKDIPLPRMASYPGYRRASLWMAGGAAGLGVLLLGIWLV